MSPFRMCNCVDNRNNYVGLRTVRRMAQLILAVTLLAPVTAAQGDRALSGLEVVRTYKETGPSGDSWKIELRNTSQRTITALGVSFVFSGGGVPSASGTVVDMAGMFADHEALAAISRPRMPDSPLRMINEASIEFLPGRTWTLPVGVPQQSGNQAFDSLTAKPTSVVFADGTAIGVEEDLATIFAGRQEMAERLSELSEYINNIKDRPDAEEALQARLAVLSDLQKTRREASSRISLSSEARRMAQRQEWQEQELRKLRRVFSPRGNKRFAALTAQEYEIKARLMRDYSLRK